MRLSILALFPILSAPTTASQTTLFQGSPGAPGDVWVVESDRSVTRPAALQGIELLPLDFVGRTSGDLLASNKPRLFEDVPGAARIALPSDAGSLYHYSRSDGAAFAFGYFVVEPTGRARVVLEWAGVGANPFQPRVAIDPSGHGLLVGTSNLSGGDVLEVDWSGVVPTVTNRTPHLGPLDVRPGGLCAGTDFGLALTSSGVWWFDRTTPMTATSVAFPAGVTSFGSDLVCNGPGTHVAVLAGPDPTQHSIYLLDATGTVSEASGGPVAVAGAGFLPDAQGGPFIAIAPDGATVAWRALVGTAQECFHRQVGSGPAATQVTSDANFADTINEIGMVAFLASSTLLVYVGESGPVLGDVFENGDFFRVETGGARTLTNITNTSGDTTVPFTAPGRISMEDGILHPSIGTSDRLVYFVDGDPAGELWQTDLTTLTTSPLLTGVKSLDEAGRAGARVLLSIRRSATGSPRELFGFDPGSGALTFLSNLGDADLTRITGHASGWIGAAAEFDTGSFLGRVDPSSGAGGVIHTQPLTYGPTMAFEPDGSLVSTVSDGIGLPVFFSWHPSGLARRLVPGRMAGFVLPGS